ncbi:hypothetical protein BOX15_Mlig019907g1, partial [Macrostomum lignano]
CPNSVPTNCIGTKSRNKAMTKEDAAEEDEGVELSLGGEVVLTEAHAASLAPMSLQEAGIQLTDLKYRGEGNFTLVAAYEKKRQVLRFRKVKEPYEKVSTKKTKLCHSCHLGVCESTDCSNSTISAAEPADAAAPSLQSGSCDCPIAAPHCCRCYHSRLISIKKLQTRKLKKPPKSLNLTYLYIETVMKHLLGVRFIPPIEVLHADTEYLTQINTLMRPFRPQNRLVKDIDVHYHEAIITSDVAFLPLELDKFVLEGRPSLCIELKVKQGFIPVSTLVQEKVRRTWCRFCLMQFHLKKGRQYETRSQYCPCDLFSGIKSRMVSALMSLIQTPQNNLRVFKNGTPAYIVGNESPADLAACLREFFDIPPSSSSSTNAEVTDEQLVAGFVETLYQALTYEFKSLPVSDEAPVSASAEFSYPADSHYSQLCSRRMQEEQQQQQQQPTQLSINCVLGRILSVQLLDRLGIDGTLSHYNRLVKFLQDNDTAWDCSKGSLKDFVESLQAPLSVIQSAQHYEAYLTSLVAKDCSVMLTLAPSRLPASELPDSVAHAKDPVSGRGLLMNLAIVDLDPKPFDKIRLNYKEDLEALRGFDATAAKNHRQD